MGIQHNRVKGSSVSERFSQNNKLPFELAIDPDTGEYGYKKVGADSVIPFSTMPDGIMYSSGYYAAILNLLDNDVMRTAGAATKTFTTKAGEQYTIHV